jgi:hypothetical protein
MTLAVFGYGSLVSPRSAALSLGRPVSPAALVRLRGWRRSWTTFRDNNSFEKTFALHDGTVPPFVVGLNIQRDPGCEGANGALIEISEAEAERLDLRELRYYREDVTEHIGPLEPAGPPPPAFDRVIAFTARPEHFAPEFPAGGIVVARYVQAVEAAFAELGDEQLALYRATTTPPPVEPSEVTLLRDEIPEGNPREW